ncbi:MBL fold metallo-hydrolase [Rhizobium leguminosarum]|uniref:ComEC/Rec2 family competence protein n=1 Tax=Rhizobium leguminosarum TaxID=384 RepID=UPI003ED01018
MDQNVEINMLPARDGDCLFVETCNFRILIDGGRSQTGRNELPEFLRSLPDRAGKPTIDLMILTHIDADHVAGLLTFLANVGQITIGEVWFNGLDHHMKAAGLAVRTREDEVDEAVDILGSPDVLSVEQAMRFDRLINDLKIPWNSHFDDEPVMVEDDGDLPGKTLTPGLDLVLLTPLRWKLEDFYPQWLDYTQNLDASPTLSDGQIEPPEILDVEELALEEDLPDRTKPNGASIAFVLEIGTIRILLSADAHPDDLAAGLERQYGPGRVHFSAIKVAHHGSARNNTSSLIEKLCSSCWLISTDGTRHGHPDAQAMARIVLAPKENKQLIFNYRSKVNSPWDAEDLKAKFNYTTFYGDGKSAVKVTLLTDGHLVETVP